jgi:4-hydroxy-tetrahydrodipicolinate reductase
MKIALIGYGKMGKEIEKIALERNHEVILKISSANVSQISEVSKADVAIEFTSPESAVENILKCFDHQTPVVTGTTGWLSRLNEIKEVCDSKKGSLLYSSNFSVGVNLFFKLNEFLAALMNKHPEYDILLEETHHTQKKDAPSGTAITLAEGIIENIEGKTAWVKENASMPNEIAISSHRVENVPGTHEILYSSPIDEIKISHVAKNRKGFALGAVLAAEFIAGKQGIFTMNDVLKIN